MPHITLALRATALATLALAGASVGTVDAQSRRGSAEGGLREMKLERFVDGRPAASKPPARQARSRFRRKGAALPAATDGDALIGVTIWRLRRPTAGDPAGTREIVHKEAGDATASATPERIALDRGLELGQDFRLSVETPRKGYLYVVDQSRYADGRRGAPTLIFPTTRIREGDNAVLAGRVVELPSRLDRPDVFTIESSGPGLEAEEIVLLVSPEPLPIEIGRDATQLTSEQVEAWERQWGAGKEALELVSGTHVGYSEAERAAGSGTLLTRDDPLPQTIYRIAARPGSPLFLRFEIPVRPPSNDVRAAHASSPAKAGR